MISNLLVMGAVLTGAFFTLLSGFGLIKFKTFSARLHSASLTSSLGILLVMLGAGIWHNSLEGWVRVVLVILFVSVTSPVAAHVLARAYHLRRPK